MTTAVIYARVSGKDQEREGFSIPAQLKLLREYGQSHAFQVIQEFIDVETAKIAGRKQFGEMVRFFKQNKNCRVLLVEKTDRLYRNFKDYVILEDLDIEVHLPKEGQIISKDAKSQAKLAHGIHLVMARNYIENLREEVCKGMRQKAEQGVFPGRPPVGYQNNKAERTIEVNPEKSLLATRIFELYGTGKYSLQDLRSAVAAEFGVRLSKGYLKHTLKNPFYSGSFYWQGQHYHGSHTPLISLDLFDRVQNLLHGRSRPKSSKHHFAYAGLLRCAYDGCAVTAERKKEKYTYYRCTGYHGKCALPYFREEDLGDRLAVVLKDVQIPDEILARLTSSLMTDKHHQEELAKKEQERLTLRLALARRRLDQAYVDKVDGKIAEEFWQRKSAEWREEERRIISTLQTLDKPLTGRIINIARILELANQAYSLYLRQLPAERAKLLRIVLSNCTVDAVNVYPAYRKPFDLIFRRAKSEEWWTW